MADLPPPIEREHGAARVTADLADADRYSVVVDRLRVTRTDGALTAPAAGRVAEAVDYLGERLRLLEAEPDGAIVRSAAPVPAEGGRQFYELRFQGDGMTMERRQCGDGGAAPVPFVLPKQQLDRLVDDLGQLIGHDAPAAPAPAAAPPDLGDGLFAGHKGCC